jgi:hypothetical protein
VWVAVKGDPEQLNAAEALIDSTAAEPPCQI